MCQEHTDISRTSRILLKIHHKLHQYHCITYELSKEKKAIQYKNLIQKLIKYQNINNIIIYSDDSKNEKTSNLDADIFYTKNFATENSKSLS